MSLPAPSSVAPRRILFVDDDALRLKLGTLQLTEAGFVVHTASCAHEAFEQAKRQVPEAILSDVIMGDLDGFSLCRLLRDEPTLAGIPVVLTSAHYQEEPDQQLASRVGAAALVAKTPELSAEIAALRSSLASPPRATPPEAETALYERHLRTNARQMSMLADQAKNAELRYRTLFQNANDAIALLSPRGEVIEANERWGRLVGLDPLHLVDRRPLQNRVVAVQRADGKPLVMEFSLTQLEMNDKQTVLAIGRDVTAQAETNAALVRAEAKYRSLIERMPDTVWTMSDSGLTFMTPNIELLSGFSHDEILRAGPALWAERIHPEDKERVRSTYLALRDTHALIDLEYRWQHRDGRWVWVHDRVMAVYERDGAWFFDGLSTDVTEKKRLEDQFRQAQKMEAIGQLTGGVAHDFNNLLAVVLANCHFLLESLGDKDPRREDVEEIKAAGNRAAALTRQLLAFSRRQVIEPVEVNLNTAVANLEKMLRRLIGEDIEFSVRQGATPDAICVDMGQLDQLVMNLVVNARDAMPKGGRLAIETSNVTLDEAAASQASLEPGVYVALSITDTGIGMDAETKRRIFEPFFTTKAPGRGTGLGLSTCYGIVQQSRGLIRVQSEVGQGTTFTVLFPAFDESSSAKPASAAKTDLRGEETILIIEDDARVRRAVERTLAPRGYRLLLASSGAEAVVLAQREKSHIDLVLSDVVMPGASGPDVVAQVQACADVKRTLFMSGYTEHPALQGDGVRLATNFIQKPFVPDALALKVREVLEAAA
ncbi:MAG: response regulator [Archangium sp.]|nr:response regulator [Archangium sp.]